MTGIFWGIMFSLAYWTFENIRDAAKKHNNK
jgi:hypothetical protein